MSDLYWIIYQTATFLLYVTLALLFVTATLCAISWIGSLILS